MLLKPKYQSNFDRNKSFFGFSPSPTEPQDSKVVVTAPIRSSTVQYDTVPTLIPDTVHIDGTVPEVTYINLESTGTAQYGTTLNHDFTPVTVPVPIRSNSVQCATVPPFISPDAVLSHTVPENTHINLHGISTGVQIYDTLSNLQDVPATVPPSFVHGLFIPKRTDSCLRNKYMKKRKLSRTLVVPRIIEYSKDADPHLDQNKPLTVNDRYIGR